MTDSEMTAEIVAAHYRAWLTADAVARGLRDRYEGAIVRAYRSGVGQSALAGRCGLSRQEIHRILTKHGAVQRGRST